VPKNNDFVGPPLQPQDQDGASQNSEKVNGATSQAKVGQCRVVHDSREYPDDDQSINTKDHRTR